MAERSVKLLDKWDAATRNRKNTLAAQKVVELLNKAFQIDPDGVASLLSFKITVKRKLGEALFVSPIPGSKRFANLSALGLLTSTVELLTGHLVVANYATKKLDKGSVIVCDQLIGFSLATPANIKELIPK